MAREHDVADLLSRDIDMLLQDAGRLESEALPEDYGELLCLARRLLRTDFSAHSRLREPLRKRLLRHSALPSPRTLHPGPRVRSYFWRRHPTLLGTALVMMLLLIAPLARPGALTAGAQRFESWVMQVILRRPPAVQYVLMSASSQLPPETSTLPEAARVAPVRGGVYPVTFITEQTRDWALHTSIGTFRGDAPLRLDPVVRRFVTLPETQAAAGCRLHQPGYLPAGYTFDEGVVTPIDVVYLFYRGPKADIVLAQIGGREPLSTLAGSMPLPFLATRTDKPIRVVQLDSRPATWIEGHGLIWEADQSAFLVGGRELNLDEAKRIAMSVN